MKKFTKRYQLWTRSEGNYYAFTEYETIEECLLADKYAVDWYITEKVNFKVEKSTN